MGMAPTPTWDNFGGQTPQAPPKIRPRALTAPLTPKNTEHRWRSRVSWNPFKKKEIPQTTADQSQSPLFAKLPTEIRELIFRESLAGHWLHIVHGPGRLLAVTCSRGLAVGVQSYTAWHMCGTFFASPDSPMVRRPFYTLRRPKPVLGAAPLNVLALLKTCRLVYSEAVNILYKGNVFDFDSLETIIPMARQTLQPRLDQIRKMNINWDARIFEHPVSHPISYDHRTWREACHILASLTGLQELAIHFGDYYTLSDTDGFWEALAPLHQIKPRRAFYVIFTGEIRMTSRIELEDKPFRVLFETEDQYLTSVDFFERCR